MGHQATEPLSIGAALVSVRAAIDLVEHGAARRVTVALPDGESLLPAARALARAAGLTLIVTWRGASVCELAISHDRQLLQPRHSERIEHRTPRVAS